MNTTPIVTGGIAAAVTLMLLAPAAAIADETTPVETVEQVEADIVELDAETPITEPAQAVAVVDEESPAVEEVQAAAETPAVEAPVVDDAAVEAAVAMIEPAVDDDPATPAPAPAQAALIAPGAPAALIAGTRTVSFTFTDQAGEPTPGAAVVAVDAIVDAGVASGVAGVDGVAVINDLPFGEYTFLVLPPSGRGDLVGGYWDGAATSADTQVVTISLTSAASFPVQLQADPTPLGAHTIVGRIHQTNGPAIRNAAVTLVSTTDSSAYTAFTDADGYYTLAGIPTGDYILTAVRKNASGSSDVYAPRWFGGSDAASAAIITITPSTDAVSDYSMGMDMIVDAIVDVAVTDPYGDPVTNGIVSAYNSGGDLVAEAWTDLRGIARFETLLGGEVYRFSANAIGGSATIAGTVEHTVDAKREQVVRIELGLGNLDANDDEYTFDAGVLFDSGVDGGVRANDTPGDLLSVELLTAPAYGLEFELHPDGRFTYRAADGFDGLVTFTYRLVGPDGLVSGATTVRLDVVDDVPVAPQAVADAYETPAGTALVVDAPGVLANDVAGGYPELRVYDVVDEPEHGSLVLDQDGTFDYVPDPGFAGEDAFTYRIEDGVSLSDAVVVTIAVGDPVVSEHEGDAAGAPSSLAGTGASGPWLAGLLGAVALVAGALLAAVTRRRRAE